MRIILPIIFYFFAFQLLAQTEFEQTPFTSAEERATTLAARTKLQEKSVVRNLPIESVGPAVFGGRIVDLDVSPKDPTHFYAAYASGGLWKTINNGTTFEALFQNEDVMTIGDIAVDWTSNTIWLGSGEVNSSRSSYAGNGIYKSEDGGESWNYKGLAESHHIGRIVLHPTDPNTLWVAVLGHLYSKNEARGVYKTEDGGATWKKVLYVGNEAGAVELIINPKNSNELYAAIWQRSRRAWNFEEAGPLSGIWKTGDGGENWIQLNTKESGFPNHENVGRIGLAINKDYVYAFVDNQARRPEKKKKKSDALTKDALRTISKEDFLNLDDNKLNNFLKSNGFEKKYSAKYIKERISTEELKPQAIIDYLEDANSNLFNTPVVGAEVYRSKDGGLKWEKTHEKYLDDVVFSYGYYFGMIQTVYDQPEHIYIAGVPVLKSKDGGKTFENINGENVHVDHHALWINPLKNEHLILGNDGGINISYDDGNNWTKVSQPAVGQFYALAVDDQKPYNIYGGTQDNGVWKGPNNYEAGASWQMTGNYPYKMLIGGDGMQIAIDSRDQTVYTGFQFGNYFRIDPNTHKRTRITPKHKLGQKPFRWNWQTPIHLSIHNRDILYMGSNMVHRSMNGGDTWQEISDDLTHGGLKGDVPFGTLTSIHESPLRFGLIYTGSDDGKIYVTKDGGYEWKDISESLPNNLWVSRVQASNFNEGTVYASLNGYRFDDFRSLIYASNDYGETWKQIGQELPMEPVNVIKEDPSNEKILYVGTDHGLYLSLDKGENFMSFSAALPAVPVHDVVVQNREKDLIIGTHGRSIFKAEIEEIQQLDQEILDSELYVFEVDSISWSKSWGNTWSKWLEAPESDFYFPIFCRSAGKVKVEISANDKVFKTIETEVGKGINYLDYALDVDIKQIENYTKWLAKKHKEDKDFEMPEAAKNEKYYLEKGTYQALFEKDGRRITKTFYLK